ncbi:CPBP family intramembrane metalloprotease (plasmid) [Arthrobacter citreus]|nr:CPBP family intramembrane metalloprotease [Arthrobacter citreus]
MENKIWKIGTKRVWFYSFIWMIASFLVVSIGEFFLEETSSTVFALSMSDSYAVWYLVALELIFLLFVVPWMIKRQIWRANGLPSVQTIVHQTWKWIILISLFLTSEILIGTLSSPESIYATLIPTGFYYNPVVTTLFVIIVMPLFEEIVFRRLILGTFLDAKNKLWHLIGISISSFSFGAFYLNDLHDLRLYPFYVVYGILLSAAYLKTRRLYIPLLMHLMYNVLLHIIMFAH